MPLTKTVGNFHIRQNKKTKHISLKIQQHCAKLELSGTNIIFNIVVFIQADDAGNDTFD